MNSWVELDQGSEPNDGVQKTSTTPQHTSKHVSINMEYFDSLRSILNAVDDAASYGIPSTPKKMMGKGYFETDITVDQEDKIKRMIDLRLAENMPILEKIMNSVVDRRLRLVLATEPGNGQNWPGLTKNATLRENVDVEKALILESLHKIESVKTISYRQSNNRLFLVIVYDGQEHEKAFDQIEEGLIKLENALPKYEFEPWILHSSESEERHFQDTETVLQRS